MKLQSATFALIALASSSFAGDVTSSIGGDHSFNGNSGTININQHNTISNSDSVIKKRISAIAGKDDKQGPVFASIAKEANATSGSLEDKRKLCQQKVEVFAKVMKYDFGLYLNKCPDVFH